jgi:nitrile hydratase
MLPKEKVAEAMSSGAPATRQIDTPPRFVVGTEVQTITHNPSTHTRLPRYARDKRGMIVAYEGAHIFPDKHAHGYGLCPEHLYRIRFENTTLWGQDCDGPGAVYLTLWESHLVGGAD